MMAATWLEAVRGLMQDRRGAHHKAAPGGEILEIGERDLKDPALPGRGEFTTVNRAADRPLAQPE